MSALDWMADALCAQTDTEAFYPEQGQSSEAARAICAACPVRTECADHIMAIEPPAYRYGIWAGTTARSRYHTARNREAAA